MLGLSAAELASMRSDLEQLLPDTCTILSPTRASDGQGGFTETWGTVTASEACRLDWLNDVEIIGGAAVQVYTGFVLTLPYDATLLTTYRVVHGGNTYAVRGVDNDKSWPIVKRARVEKV